MKKILMEEMTWPEIKSAIDSGVKTVILFSASIEQHGPHLPEVTDTTIGYAQATELANRLGNALVAPVIRPGLSDHHMMLPGSVSLRPEVFAGLVEDHITSYIRHGFDTIILNSSHGGNIAVLSKLCDEMDAKYPDVRIINGGADLMSMSKILAEIEEADGLETGSAGMHACDCETSIMLYVRPDLVHMDRAERGFVGTPSEETLERFFTMGVLAVSEIGVMGNPVNATAERGKKYMQKIMDLQEKVVREKLS